MQSTQLSHAGEILKAQQRGSITAADGVIQYVMKFGRETEGLGKDRGTPIAQARAACKHPTGTAIICQKAESKVWGVP